MTRKDRKLFPEPKKISSLRDNKGILQLLFKTSLEGTQGRSKYFLQLGVADGKTVQHK